MVNIHNTLKKGVYIVCNQIPMAIIASGQHVIL